MSRVRAQARVKHQRAYMTTVDEFAREFGKPGEVVIALGDWSRQLHYPKYGKWHERGKMPSATMAVLDAFRACGYTIAFIDGSFTSVDCSRARCGGRECCDSDWLHTRRRVRVRPRDPQSPMYNHTVKTIARCKWCKVIYDRDFNGARNILRRALELRGP